MGSEEPPSTPRVATPPDTVVEQTSRQSNFELQTLLTDVADTAAVDANTPSQLLGTYLGILTDAIRSGRRPDTEDLMAVRKLGQHAAEQGIDADQAVDLYLSAAWRMWQQLPRLFPASQSPAQVRNAAETVLRVSADAVEMLIEGHQEARRRRIRQEESTRREFVNDLLRGDTDVARLVERAEPFGLDLGRSHQLLLAAGVNSTVALDSVAIAMERAIVDRYGDREVLIATKDDLLVVLLPGVLTGSTVAASSVEPATDLHTQLSRHSPGTPWQVAAGRAYPGAYGIARSYEEAREALHLARRLNLKDDVLHPHAMLAYRVLGRDQSALADLVDTVLHPLTTARGGAEPLLLTLRTYFATGAVSTATARNLHLSIRAVTYRLDRIHALTGHNPLDPADHLTLHMAATGAQLLDWPATPLPGPRRS